MILKLTDEQVAALAGHTPGPWTVDHRRGCMGVVAPALTELPGLGCDYPGVVAYWHQIGWEAGGVWPDADRPLGDAALIAAAPDLLADWRTLRDRVRALSEALVDISARLDRHSAERAESYRAGWQSASEAHEARIAELEAERDAALALAMDWRVAAGIAADTLCPQCGLGVQVDEDGCCQNCGSGAMGPAVDSRAAGIREVEATMVRLGLDAVPMRSLQQVEAEAGNRRAQTIVRWLRGHAAELLEDEDPRAAQTVTYCAERIEDGLDVTMTPLPPAADPGLLEKANAALTERVAALEVERDTLASDLTVARWHRDEAADILRDIGPDQPGAGPSEARPGASLVQLARRARSLYRSTTEELAGWPLAAADMVRAAEAKGIEIGRDAGRADERRAILAWISDRLKERGPFIGHERYAEADFIMRKVGGGAHNGGAS